MEFKESLTNTVDYDVGNNTYNIQHFDLAHIFFRALLPPLD